MIVSLLQINLGRFIGLSQAAAYLQGEKLPLPEETLQYSGVYRLVRHPLYLFSLLVIWPMGTMNESLLAFNIGTTIYFLIGSIFEERKLASVYGKEYRQYQKRTPSIIPRIVRLREH
jgi:protein-S-isoprenylcysteine O-methyltransferase Ste14